MDEARFREVRALLEAWSEVGEELDRLRERTHGECRSADEFTRLSDDLVALGRRARVVRGRGAALRHAGAVQEARRWN